MGMETVYRAVRKIVWAHRRRSAILMAMVSKMASRTITATASGVRWIGFAASPASVVSLPESEGDGARRSAGVLSAGWRILPGAGCGAARRSSATATVMARGPSAAEDGREREMPEVS